ncbi:MAG: uroporphyrinogen-III C-methyltransferase [Thiolinea sp.]
MIDKSDNNEADIINSEPESTKPAKAPKARGAGFALFIAFLALFFTAAGIAAGYKHWQRMSDRAKSNAREIAALEEVIASKTDNQSVEKMLEAINERHNAQQAEVAEQLTKMNQMYRQTEQFSNTVTSQVEHITSLQASLQSAVAPESPKAWNLAEVSFLLKLANRQLHLSGNREAASRALTEADQILSETGSVSYLPVRQQIASDLAALEAIEVPDLSALSQQINLLGLKLKPLPETELSAKAADTGTTDSTGDEAASTQTEPDADAAAQSDSSNTAQAWQNYKEKAVKILSDAVVIRKLDKPLADELSFEAREQAYQLLQLRLEALRLMALQQQDSAYQQQIELIRGNISDYYPAEQAAVSLKELDKLAANKLNPVLPDISGSLRQFEKARMAEGSQ